MSRVSSPLAITPSLLTNGEVDWVIVGLLFLALVSIASPLLLAVLYQRQKAGEAKSGYTSFFQIPFITWFLVHNYIPTLGILAVVGLALADKITSDTTATLLSGLFGYVLGNAGTHAVASTSQGKPQSTQQQQKEPE